MFDQPLVEGPGLATDLLVVFSSSAVDMVDAEEELALLSAASAFCSVMSQHRSPDGRIPIFGPLPCLFLITWGCLFILLAPELPTEKGR
jgi:ABC-type transport system involved in cytochrome c biogenesis permease subunit